MIVKEEREHKEGQNSSLWFYFFFVSHTAIDNDAETIYLGLKKEHTPGRMQKARRRECLGRKKVMWLWTTKPKKSEAGCGCAVVCASSELDVRVTGRRGSCRYIFRFQAYFGTVLKQAPGPWALLGGASKAPDLLQNRLQLLQRWACGKLALQGLV